MVGEGFVRDSDEKPRSKPYYEVEAESEEARREAPDPRPVVTDAGGAIPAGVEVEEVPAVSGFAAADGVEEDSKEAARVRAESAEIPSPDENSSSDESDDSVEEPVDEPEPVKSVDEMSKAELQEEARRRGVSDKGSVAALKARLK